MAQLPTLSAISQKTDDMKSAMQIIPGFPNPTKICLAVLFNAYLTLTPLWPLSQASTSRRLISPGTVPQGLVCRNSSHSVMEEALH